MSYKKMRDYSHEEFVNLVQSLNEEQLIGLSTNYGGYPVFFRMSLDERINHIPFIQPGAAIIIRNKEGKILLQKRTDRDKWGLPGGCQELGEDLKTTAIREVREETGLELMPEELMLIDTLSGETRKNSYPNGDIVYNNTSLYLVDIDLSDASSLRGDSETKKLEFFDIESIPDNLMDIDLINTYINYSRKKVKKNMKDFIKIELEDLVEWNEPNGEGCIVSDRITKDGYKVGYMYREEPSAGNPDSGWVFMAGNEEDEYINDPNNSHIFSINTVCNYDRDIIPYIHSEVGSVFIRINNKEFEEDKKDKPIFIDKQNR